MQTRRLLGRPLTWLAPGLDPLAAWAGALALFLAVLALRLELPTLGHPYPFLAFFPAVLLAAWIGGRAPAVVVAILATASAWWFLIRSPGTVDWPSAGQTAALVLFLGSGVLAALLIGGLACEAGRASTAQARAEAALLAQQGLATELQHRVANNLQVVASTLLLRARELEGAPAAALDDAIRRLDALSRLYRGLLSVGEASDAGDILAELCRTQMAATGDGRVALDIVVDPDARLDPERLTLVGMIVSEAMSNALKHGFPEGRAGRLAVRLRTLAPGRIELEVRDNGVGLPEGFDPHRTESFGLRIVHSLAHRLGGTLSLVSERGTVLRMAFPSGAAARL